MVSTVWDVPGIQSGKSLEFLEQALNPICVYDEQGHTVYASPSFLEWLQVDAEAIDFFSYFHANSIPQTTLERIWEDALQGNTVEFLFGNGDISQGDVEKQIECSLRFNPEAKLMFLQAKRIEPDAAMGKLMEEYERAIALSEHPSLATALLNLDGTIIKCNSRFHQLLGTSDQEILDIERFEHPDDQLVDGELRHKLLTGEINSYTVEKRFISRNKEIIWVNVCISSIDLTISVNGSKKYLAVLLEDVTESRKTYNALVRTEEKWKAFVLNSPYLFIQTSNEGQILYASPAVEQILGYSKEELMGRQITEFIHPHYFSEFERVFQSWKNNLQASQTEIESWWRVKSGKWVSLHLQGQRFPAALEIDGVVITGYNITTRKCLEIELTASEEKFRTLVLNLPGAVFRCDPTYTMESISEGIEDLTGYPAIAFIQNQVQSYLSIVHPDDIALLKDALVQSVLDRHRSEIEYRIIHADGSVRWVSERKQGIFDQNGSLVWMDGVLLDISAQKRLEAERKQSDAERKQAEEKLRRYQTSNLATVQMIPNWMRTNSMECFPTFLLPKTASKTEG